MLEAIGISIAANIATKVIEKVSQRLGGHISPSNLERAYKEAVRGFIANVPEKAIEQGVIESFFQRPKVVDELSKLVITTEGIPDLKLLAEELVKAGFDASIAPKFDFSSAMLEFTDGFLNAAVKDSDLSRIINTRYLRQIAETMGALVGDGRCKIGIRGKEVEADVTYIEKVVNNYYFPFESVTPEDLDKLRRVYFTGLVDKYEWMDFRGILQLRNIVRLRLDDIFISLNAFPEIESYRESLEAKHGLYETVQERRYRVPLESSEKKRPLEEVLKENLRMVVLGDPGSGKTTFLKFLALTFAKGKGYSTRTLNTDKEFLPILVPLKAYADGLQQDLSLPLGDYTSQYYKSLEFPNLSELFKHELDEGNCLILLDGLDEVVSASDRKLIVERIENFVRRYPNNRYVVTSRIAGYEKARLNSQFAHFVILRFEDKEIEEFIRKWCYAFETSTGEAFDAERRASEQVTELLKVIMNTPSVKRLAANPLLLTIIALIFYLGAKLPNRRVELYQLCVNTLAETWNRARSLSGRPVDVLLGDRQLDERYVVKILSPIAFRLHVKSPAGVMSRERLEAQLVDYFCDYEQFPRGKAEQLSADFVELIREQSGILMETGHQMFGFMHPTFEEYLAARYLAGKRKVLEVIGEKLHNPNWREVILLTAGSLEGEIADDFVREILKADSSYEDILHRDLLLAGRCVADDVDMSPKLRNEIVDRLVDLYIEKPYSKLQDEILRIFDGLQGSLGWERVKAKLMEKVKSESENEQIKAIDALIYLKITDKQAMDMVSKLLDSKNKEVQYEAIDALSELLCRAMKKDPKINKLLELIESEDERLQLAVIWAIESLLSSSSWEWEINEDEIMRIVENLLKLTESKNEEIQSEAIDGLCTLTPLTRLGFDGKLINKFLEFIGSESEKVRLAAAIGLFGRLFEKRPLYDMILVNKLLKLADSKNEKIQDAAVAVLSASVGEERVANKILELIDSKSEIVRVRAIFAIIGEAHFCDIKICTRAFTEKVSEKKFVNKLFKALKCESEQVQAAALWALIELNKGEQVREKVIDAFESERESLHQVGMCGLAKLGIKDEGVTERLLKDIESENALIQASAGKVLEKFIEPDEEILRILSSRLHNGGISKERVNYESIPYFLRFENILPYSFETPCDCIYEALRSLVERWEEKKSFHRVKTNSFS
jgi:HEAT repeat protein/energy-coupling factor transporter ATP-binding protein EcfA2